MPAAFTRPTGAAHWHVLLRARAIEAGCFVVAAAQTGEHADGRETYGHSLVVDPWGEVLLDMGEPAGLGFADIDLARLAEVRARVPALRHRRQIPPVETSSDRLRPQMRRRPRVRGVVRIVRDYDDQRARGLVACPLCGDGAMEKAVMAPNIGAKGNKSVRRDPGRDEGRDARAGADAGQGDRRIRTGSGATSPIRRGRCTSASRSRRRSTARPRPPKRRRWPTKACRLRRCRSRWCRPNRQLNLFTAPEGG